MGAEKYLPLMTYTELLLSEPDRFDEKKIMEAVASLTDEEKIKIMNKLQCNDRSSEYGDMDLVKNIRRKIK